MLDLLFGCFAIFFLVQDIKSPLHTTFRTLGIISNVLWLIGCSMGFLGLFLFIANVLIDIGFALAVVQLVMEFKQ